MSSLSAAAIHPLCYGGLVTRTLPAHPFGSRAVSFLRRCLTFERTGTVTVCLDPVFSGIFGVT
jgi:hypothetical protein